MRYRPYIDGLRAVAVLPVVLFHAGIGVFSGGFVGVDIFFVISGYLITSILADEIKAGKYSILSFYERRIRRIFPALFVVFLFSAVAVSCWFLPQKQVEFGKSIAAATLFVSNIYFSRHSGYFDNGTDRNPLLHTWSLAVEEQFYIVFPLLLWVVHRYFPRRVTLVVGLAIAISFLVSVRAVAHNPTAAFYLLPGRAWELLLGSVLALASPSHPAKRWHREALTLFGLALILGSIFTYSSSTPFPGSAALVPCLGSVLILYAAAGQSLVGRMLSSRPLVYVGLLSYSLYLWHWPIIVFTKTAIRSDVLGPEAITVVVVGAFAASILSLKFVEGPFRKKKIVLRRGPLLSGAALTMGVFIAIGLYFSYGNGKAIRASEARESRFEAAQLAYRYDECFFGAGASFADFTPDKCVVPVAGRPNYLLIGDSHAAHLWSGLAKVFPEVNFLMLTSAGCHPLLKVESADKDCVAVNRYTFQELIPKVRVDGVIISALWNERWSDAEPEEIGETLDYIHRYTNRVFVVGPIIQYYDNLPDILQFYAGNDLGRALEHEHVKGIEKLDQAVKKATLDHHGNYISILDTVCPEGACRVYADDNTPLQWDYGHLTSEGSATVAKLWKESGMLP